MCIKTTAVCISDSVKPLSCILYRYLVHITYTRYAMWNSRMYEITKKQQQQPKHPHTRTRDKEAAYCIPWENCCKYLLYILFMKIPFSLASNGLTTLKQHLNSWIRCSIDGPGYNSRLIVDVRVLLIPYTWYTSTDIPASISTASVRGVWVGQMRCRACWIRKADPLRTNQTNCTINSIVVLLLPLLLLLVLLLMYAWNSMFRIRPFSYTIVLVRVYMCCVNSRKRPG